MAKLIINPTSGARKEIPIVEKVLSIGRDPSNDLVLSDGMVSRRHAIMELRGDQYVLRDNNSSNGTLVNGDRVENDQPLRDGDLIAIGSARLLFQAGEEEPAPPKSAGPLPTTKPVPVAVPPQDKKCPSCGLVATPSDVYCRKCGHELSARAEHHVVCSQCGASVAAPAEFCSKCGKALLKEEDKYRLRTKLQPFDPAVLQPKAPRPASAPGQEKARSPGSHPPRRGEQPVPRPGAGKEVPAGFWIRLVAYLVDNFIIALPLMIAGGLSMALAAGRGSPADSSGTSSAPDAVVAAGAILTAALLIVYPLYFWAVRGSTPGKRLLGLSLVGASGKSPIGLRSAFLRLVGYFLNGVTLGIGFLLVGLTQDKRGLHDRLAETHVVRQRPS